MTIQQMLLGAGGEADPLFSFTSFQFTTGGMTGREGPTRAILLSGYNTSAYTWLNDTSLYDVDSNARGVQMFTVPETGTYRITCEGASGGHPYDSNYNYRVGYPAKVRGDFSLSQGTILRIVVGQRGLPLASGSAPPNYGQSYNSGGGGGSFVFYTLSDTEPLIVAGGGGGGAYSGSNYYRAHASQNLSGAPGTCITNDGTQDFIGLVSGQSLGYGGVNNNNTSYKAGCGAGWKGNGGGGHQYCSTQSPYHIQGGWSKSKTLDTSGSTSNGGPFMGGWGGNNQAGYGSQLGGFGGGGGGTGRCGSCQAGGGGGYSGGGQTSSNNSSPTMESLAGGGNYVASSASNRTYIGLGGETQHGSVTIEKL